AWCAYLGDWAMWPGFVAAGGACAGLQVQRCCAGAFRAFDEFGAENAAAVLQGVAVAALVAALILIDRVSLGGVAAMLALSQALPAAYMIVRLVRRWPLGWRLRGAVLRDWLRAGGLLGGGDMIRGMTWQMDSVLVGLLQPAAAGLYNVAYRPLGPLNW